MTTVNHAEERMTMQSEEERRITAWSMEGREILASVRKYEDEHPQGALCLHPLLMVMDQCTEARPEPGACDREGCPVLHDDPAHPIHPEDLTKAFHERTGRCMGAPRDAEIHSECAGVELQHRTGNHNACLPVEDGFTEAEVHQAQMYLDSDEYDGAVTDVGEYLRAQRLEDRDPHANCQEGYCDPWQQGRASDPCPASGLLQRLEPMLMMPVQDEQRFISPTTRAVGMISVDGQHLWMQRLADGGSEDLPLLWAMSDGTVRWKAP